MDGIPGKWRRSEAFEDGDPFLQLPKTGLLVVSGELRRLNKLDTPMLRLPLGVIESVEYRSKFDPGSLLFIAMGGGAAAIGHYVSENNVLTCVLYVVALVCLTITVFGAYGQQIVIQTKEGSHVISCSDLNDECEGFVASLRSLLGSK